MNDDVKIAVDLTPEARRVLCAKALGWTEIFHNAGFHQGKSDELAATHNGGRWTTPIPDPDESLADAFNLVEHLKKQGWIPEIYGTLDDKWIAAFTRRTDGRVVREDADTAPKAIVSAFLATGAATEEVG